LPPIPLPRELLQSYFPRLGRRTVLRLLGMNFGGEAIGEGTSSGNENPRVSNPRRIQVRRLEYKRNFFSSVSYGASGDKPRGRELCFLGSGGSPSFEGGNRKGLLGGHFSRKRRFRWFPFLRGNEHRGGFRIWRGLKSKRHLGEIQTRSYYKGGGAMKDLLSKKSEDLGSPLLCGGAAPWKKLAVAKRSPELIGRSKVYEVREGIGCKRLEGGGMGGVSPERGNPCCSGPAGKPIKRCRTMGCRQPGRAYTLQCENVTAQALGNNFCLSRHDTRGDQLKRTTIPGLPLCGGGGRGKRRYESKGRGLGSMVGEGRMLFPKGGGVK